MIALRLLGALGAGVMIGGIVGVIMTADWVYTVVWTVGMGVLVLCVCVTVPRTLLRRRAGSAPASSAGPAVIAPLVVLVLAAGGALAPAVSAAASGRLDNMVTGHHQMLALDAIAAAAGNHDAVDIDFYPGYVIAQVPTSVGSTHYDTWEFRSGRATDDGPETIPPDAVHAAFDVRAAGIGRIPARVAAAIRLSRIAAPTEFHVYVMRAITGRRTAPQTTVSIHDARGGANIVYDLRGRVVEKTGSAFDSAG
jgi:hypothetical protein